MFVVPPEDIHSLRSAGNASHWEASILDLPVRSNCLGRDILMLCSWFCLSYSCPRELLPIQQLVTRVVPSCLLMYLLAHFCSCVCLHPSNTLVYCDKTLHLSALSSYFESGLHHVFLLASLCPSLSLHPHFCLRGSHASRARAPSMFHAWSCQHKQAEQNGTR